MGLFQSEDTALCSRGAKIIFSSAVKDKDVDRRGKRYIYYSPSCLFVDG